MSTLLVIGLDGGTAGWIERWAAEGYLPNIARLLREGVSAHCGGAELVVEHGTWVSLLSGISRADFGYYYFRQLEPGSYRLKTVTAADFDAPPFWAWMRGKRALILDPHEGALIAGLDGLQVINWDAYTPQDPAGYPFAASDPQVGKAILRQFGAPLRSPDKHNASPAENALILTRLLQAVRRKGELARWLLAQQPYDLAFITFPQTHSAGHQFFAPGDDLQDAARQVYAAVDAEIGRMIALLPVDTSVALIAPIGIHDNYPNGGLADALLRALGYHVPPALGSAPAGLLPLARRLVPAALRAQISRRLHTREQREAIVSAQFAASADWTRTRAFAIPASYTSTIRVNLRGREPQGIVAPGAEYSALLEEMEADLRALIDPRSGAPVVERIQRAVDLFPGGPPELLPDLFVDWNTSHFIEEAAHPRVRLRQPRPEFFRRTDHSAPGFFALCGPVVRAAGRLPDIDVLSIAPTLLSLLGQAQPARMRAAPLDIFK